MKKHIIRTVTRQEAEAYAQTVIEKKFGCTTKKKKYIGGGSYGFVFLFEIDKEPYRVIMKACRTKGMCEREARELILLGKNCPVHMPQVYFTFVETQQIPIDFICMEFVEGTDTFTHFEKLFTSKKKKEEFALKVVSTMNFWHSQHNDRFGLVGEAVHDTWLGYYKNFAYEILEAARELNKNKKLDSKTLATMERAWLNFDFIFSQKVEKASLIHGDLNVMNIMTDKNLNVTAIIDPLESKWADKEYDLFQLRNLTGERFRLYDTYKKLYPTSEKVDLKCAFYGLYHEIYCYISSGSKVDFILKPLVKRMNKELKKADL